jgi:amidohydrolase
MNFEMQRVDSDLSAADRLSRVAARCDAEIASIETTLIKLRRSLHAHPEPSGEEVETSQCIARTLDEAGIPGTICRDGLGVVANLTVGSPSNDAPLIAIRGDIDALRMPDEKTVEYSSQVPNVAHACGHDVHTSVLIGAALAASRVTVDEAEKESVPGWCLRFLFQPAEETSQGADWLVEQGVMDGVDAILGLHVDPERAVGTVGIRYGVLTANCDEVVMIVGGHGGHAARPHHTHDPIAAAAHLVSTLYEFLPRSVDARSASVFTVGKIEGGYAPNVIPESVELHGTLRTIDMTSRESLQQRIREICSGVEQTSGARVQVRFEHPLESVDNHPRIAAALEEVSLAVVGRDNIDLIDQPSMGGEDFSVYLDHAPGALLRLGCADPASDSPAFLHSPLFDVDERVIALGSRVLLRTALLLGTPSLR